MDLPGELTAPVTDVRVSDVERDRVVERLKQRTADGTLTLDEFADRVDRALTARTQGDLEVLVADLPVGREPRRKRARRWVLSLMAGNHIKGRWRAGDRVVAVAVMGSCQIDFRRAEIDVDEVHVTAIALMGGVDIIVPEGIDVSMGGLPIMGGRGMHVKDVPVLPGSPHIVVHAFPVMGGVSVRSRPHKRPGVEEDPAPAEEVTDALPPNALAGLDGTVTIMFSDICDYSGITDRLGDRAAHELLREHNRLIRAQIAAHEGHEVKSNGDGLMVAFSSVARALRCGVAIQQAFADRNARNPREPIRVHMGLHAGEVVRDGDDFLGGTVIVASRLADAAGPDEILVSSVARELAAGSREFLFGPARMVSLKGIAEARPVYPVDWQVPLAAG